LYNDHPTTPGKFPWKDLPKHARKLLRKDGPQSDKYPRLGLITTRIGNREYCLFGDSVELHESFGPLLTICNDCHNDLMHARVPKASLVCIDPGLPPPGLPQLNMLETSIVSLLRVMRNVVVTTPRRFGVHSWIDSSGITYPTDGRNMGNIIAGMTGHVLAFKQNVPDDLLQLFYPLPPDRLPEIIQMVLIAPADDINHAKALARKCPAFIVRGELLYMWCIAITQALEKIGAIPNVQVRFLRRTAEAYCARGTHVPEVIVENAVCTGTEEEAQQLLKYYSNQTQGYTEPSRTESHAPDTDDAGSMVDDMLPNTENPTAMQSPQSQMQSPQSQMPFEAQGYTESSHSESHMRHTNDGDEMVDAMLPNTQNPAAMSSAMRSLPSEQTASATLHSNDAEPPAQQHMAPEFTPEELAAIQNEVLNGGYMAGLHDVDMHINALPEYQVGTAIAERLKFAQRNVDTLNAGGILALAKSNKEIFSDYDRMWPILAHPTMFPNLTGARPDGMSHETWVGITLRRPRNQFQRNPLFIMDMFDIVQRHQVNTKTSLYLKGNPQAERMLNGISLDETKECLEILAERATNPTRANTRLQNASAHVKEMHRSVRIAGANVIGSPQSLGKIFTSVTFAARMEEFSTTLHRLCSYTYSVLQ
jgi:hypothetical protein